MTQQARNHRIAAVKVADTVNRIEGVPVTEQARRLSAQWARGDISGAQMKALLIAAHKRPATGDKQ